MKSVPGIVEGHALHRLDHDAVLMGVLAAEAPIRQEVRHIVLPGGAAVEEARARERMMRSLREAELPQERTGLGLLDGRLGEHQ